MTIQEIIEKIRNSPEDLPKYLLIDALEEIDKRLRVLEPSKTTIYNTGPESTAKTQGEEPGAGSVSGKM